MTRRISVVAAALLSACTLQRWQPSQANALDDHMTHMSPADLRVPWSRLRGGAPQGIAGLPASNVNAAARLQASSRHAEWVKIAWEPGSKDSLMAWIVYPTTSSKAPVVVVVHEIFGLSTWVRAVADQLAADGFIAIAPDLVSRARGGPSTVELAPEAARGMIGSVDFAERNRGISAAANYAMTQPSAEPRYAVIGFCWGGSTVFGHAVHGGVRGFSGGVAYYGAPFATGGARATETTPAVPAVPVADSLAKIRVPTMLLNGSRDARIGALMPAIDSMMKAMRKDYVGVNYEGAIHGFLRAQDDPTTGANADAGPANVAASKDAWLRTLAFLRKNLAAR